MNKMIRLKSIILILVSLILVSGSGLAQEYRNGMKQGVVRIKFQPHLTSTLSTLKTTHENGVLSTGIQAFDAVNKELSALEMKRVFPYSPKFEQKHRQHGLHLWYEVSVSNEVEAMAAAAAYSHLGEVASAEPVFERQLIQPGSITKVDVPAIKATGNEYFNDPLLSDQWHYNNTGQTGQTPGADINLYEAWGITTGSKNVIVSIHDEGVDYKHEDLADAMWVNEAELNGEENVDDDGNGYKDDIYGFNFASNMGAIDRMDHGTHVAGTVGAVNNNGIGVGGVAGGSGSGDGVRIMSCQILGGRGSGNTPDSYVFAADNGAVISQNSWGYTVEGAYAQVVLDAIDYFIAEAGDYEGSPMKGGLVVFAAGNDNSQGLHYPGAYENCISVSALDANLTKAGYSNYGITVDIAAPGGDSADDAYVDPDKNYSLNGVLSTIPHNGYGYMDGTSMACPHVSGVAALVVSKHGKMGFTNEDLKTHLFTGVRDIDGLEGNEEYVGKLGIGATDAALALATDNGIAPNKTSNLTLMGIAQDFVNLEWTVPADEDDEQALAYEVIYSTDTITMANMKFANIVNLESKKEAGDTIAYELQGLKPLTEYYFAVRGIDRWGNVSDFSNILKATTNDGPDASVDLESASFTINVEENVEGSASFNLLNSGEGMLKWFTDSRHVSIKPRSAEIRYPELKVSSNGSGALKDRIMKAETAQATYDNSKKYYPDITGGYWKLGEMDTEYTNSSATRFFVDETEGFNLTDVNARVYHDEETGPVILEIYEGENISDAKLLLAQEVTRTPEESASTHVDLDEDLYFEKGKSFWIVLHVPSGNLYPLGANLEQEQDMSENCYFSTNLGRSWAKLEDVYYDNQIVWEVGAVSKNESLGEYLTLSPAEGQVPSNESQAITATINASSLVNGNYKTNIVINTNENEEQMIRVPVSFKVEGHKPILSAPRMTDFGSVIVGKDKIMQVVIENDGFGRFYFPKCNISDSQFEMVEGSIPTMEGRMKMTLTFRYKPTTGGNANAIVTLSDYKGSQVSFNLFGVGAEPPVLEISPAEASFNDLTIGDEVNGSFTIKNTGKYPLDYFLPAFADGSNMADLDPRLCKTGYSHTIRDGGMIPEEWTDISGNADGEVSASFKNDAFNYFHPVDIGFEFPFFGKMETEVNIVKFGGLSFDQNSTFNTLPIKFKSIYSPDRFISAMSIIYWWGQDFGGQIFYKRYSDKFIVQYDKFKIEQNETPFYLDFQIVLHDNGNINLNYKHMGWIPPGLLAYSYLGIEDQNQDDGLLISDAWTQWYFPSNNSSIEIVNPGLGIVSNVDKPYGNLQVGDSVEVNYTVETADLNVANYIERLAIMSNDPVNSPVMYKLNLNIVDGGAPEFNISKTELNYGQVFQNANEVRGFHISNPGKATVNVEAMSFANGYYSLSGELPVALKPGRKLEYKVKLNTAALGSYDDTLTITLSNGETHTVSLSAEVIEAPVVAVNLTEINETLEFGASKTLQLTVENNGGNPLEFAAVGMEWLNLVEKSAVKATQIPDFTYSYKTSDDEGGPAYQYVDIVETGVKLDSMDAFDMRYYWKELAMPFEFDFYGNKYDTLYVGYNGIISFTKGQEDKTFAEGGWIIPNTDMPNNYIAPCWSFSGQSYVGHYPQTGIYYHKEDDKVVITWKDWFNGFGMGTPVTWQAILYKNGNIKFQYDLGKSDNTTQWGITGIENIDGTDGVQIGSRSKWMTDDLAILLTPTQKYTVPVGGSKVFDVLVDATELYGGTYTGELHMNTNDPMIGKVNIPATLTVEGAPQVVCPDSISYGDVMSVPVEADYFWQDQFKAYEYEFELMNTGTSNLEISGMSFTGGVEIRGEAFYAPIGWDGMPMEPKWESFQMMWGGITVLPNESIKVKSIIVPSGEHLVLKDSLRVTCNVPGGYLDIPISGNVYLPPVMMIPTEDINVYAETDAYTETRTVVLDNSNGKSDLHYSLNLDYKRQETEASSTQARTAMNAGMEAPELQVGKLASTTASKSTKAEEEYNRVLKYEDKEAAETRVGYGGSLPFVAATAYTAPQDGFNLTHVMTWYVPEDWMESRITVSILGGDDNIHNAKVLHTQEVEYNITERDDQGQWLTVALDTNLVFYPKETFYVAFKYPVSVNQPHGVFRTETAVENRYFFGSGDQFFETVSTGYPEMAWMMRAAEAEAAAGAWVILTSDAEGTVPAGEQKEVSLAFTAATAAKGYNEAELLITSNDPFNTDDQVNVALYKNQRPVFEGGDIYETVKENEIFTYTVTAKDPEGDAITYSLKEAYDMLSAETNEDGFVITYSPGYEAAGSKMFAVVVQDQFGNESELKLNVDVLNVNRAPELMAGIEDREYYEDEEFDYIDLFPLFTDPDNEELSYSVTVDNPVVTIFTSEEEMAIRPLEPGEATVTVVASDAEGLSAETSFNVTIGTVTGIEDPEGTSETKVYPVPTTGPLNIVLGNDIEGEVTISILNVTGLTQYQTTVNKMSGEQVKTLNIGHMPSGIYLVKISSTNGDVVKRVVKL